MKSYSTQHLYSKSIFNVSSMYINSTQFMYNIYISYRHNTRNIVNRHLKLPKKKEITPNCLNHLAPKLYNVLPNDWIFSKSCTQYVFLNIGTFRFFKSTYF